MTPRSEHSKPSRSDDIEAARSDLARSLGRLIGSRLRDHNVPFSVMTRLSVEVMEMLDTALDTQRSTLRALPREINPLPPADDLI